MLGVAAFDLLIKMIEYFVGGDLWRVMLVSALLVLFIDIALTDQSIIGQRTREMLHTTGVGIRWIALRLYALYLRWRAGSDRSKSKRSQGVPPRATPAGDANDDSSDSAHRVA